MQHAAFGALRYHGDRNAPRKCSGEDSRRAWLLGEARCAASTHHVLGAYFSFAEKQRATAEHADAGAVSVKPTVSPSFPPGLVSTTFFSH